jgi:hypothetical protein
MKIFSLTSIFIKIWVLIYIFGYSLYGLEEFNKILDDALNSFLNIIFIALLVGILVGLLSVIRHKKGQ